jgi:hypothetical protein
MLLCANTQRYNEDGSLIYEDSIVLQVIDVIFNCFKIKINMKKKFQSVFTNARDKLMKDWEENEEQGGYRMDQMDLDDSNSASGYVRSFLLPITFKTKKVVQKFRYKKKRQKSEAKPRKRKSKKYYSDDDDDDDDYDD